MGARPGQLQLKVKVRQSPDCQSARGGGRGGGSVQWVAIHPTCLHPGPHWPPGCLWGERRCEVSPALETLRAGEGAWAPALEDSKRPPLLSHVGRGLWAQGLSQYR